MVIEQRRGRKNLMILQRHLQFAWIDPVYKQNYTPVQCLTEILLIGLLPFYREKGMEIVTICFQLYFRY